MQLMDARLLLRNRSILLARWRAVFKHRLGLRSVQLAN